MVVSKTQAKAYSKYWKGKTTIALLKTTRFKLQEYGKRSETYDDLLLRMLKEATRE